MKLVIATSMWLATAFVAALVAWRLWRGRNVVLRGRVSPRLMRMVVTVLVVAGFVGAGSGGEDAPQRRHGASDAGAAASADEAAPQALNEQSVNQWIHRFIYSDSLRLHKQHWVMLEAGQIDDAALLAELRRYAGYAGKPLDAMLTADVEAMIAGEAPPAVEATVLQETIDACIAQGRFDPWLVGYLWRKSEGLSPQTPMVPRIAINESLHRWARLNSALLRARAAAGPVPVSPRAWMSKAAPSPKMRLDFATYVKRISAEAQRLYPHVDAGTWDHEAIVPLQVTGKEPITLIRDGWRDELKPGQRFIFRRLDIIETGKHRATLAHTWVGPIALPPTRCFTGTQLANHLEADRDSRDTVLGPVVRKALDGNAAEALMLERALPLVHKRLRNAVASRPDAKGAPRLRLILSAYDETTVPQIVDPWVAEPRPSAQHRTPASGVRD